MTFAELVKLGVEKESQAEAFYCHWASKLENPGAKALLSDLAEQGGKMRSTFENLAAKEKKHKLRLETFYDEYILTED